MRPKSLIMMFLFLGVLFIAIGDRVLPKPLSTASVQARTTANKFFMGLFPKKRFRNPNAETEKDIQKLEREGAGNQK